MQQSPYALPRLNLTATCATGCCSDARVVVGERLKRMGGTYRGIGPNLGPLHHLAEVGSVYAIGEICADVCGVWGITVVGAAAMRVRVGIQVLLELMFVASLLSAVPGRRPARNGRGVNTEWLRRGRRWSGWNL